MNFFNWLSILLFLLSVKPTNGQGVNALKHKLNSDLPLEEKTETLKELVSNYYFEDLDSSLLYANQLTEFAEEHGMQANVAHGLYQQAKVHNAKGNYEEGKSVLSKSREIYQNINDKKGIAQCLNVFGNIYQNIGDYELANQYYDSTLVLARKINDSLLIANSYQGLGISCDYRGQFDKAIEHYFEGLKIFEAIEDKSSMGKVYSNIGIIYLNTKEFDNAIEYFTKSIQLKRELENYKGMAITYDNLAALYLETKNYDKAQIAVDSALVYANIIKADKQTTLLYYRKGSIFQGKGENEKALNEYKKGLALSKQSNDTFYKAVGEINIGQLLCSKKDVEKGKVYLKRALSYAEETGFLQMEQAILNTYVETFKSKSAHNEIVNKYDRLMAVNDSLYAKEKFNSISEIETKYQTEKKEAENQLLKKDKELQAATIQRQQTTLWGTVGGIVLLVLISFLLYKRNIERKKTNAILSKQKSEIETLHKELAHRVKNNLFFISTLMKMQGKRVENEEAKQAVKESEARLEAMSLLHRKLHLGENESHVNIGGYLQELCGNLQYSFPHSGNQPQIKVKADDVMVEGEPAVRIGLIVNELVTNSFKYAFKKQEKPEINVTVQSTGDGTYCLTYQDNGIGIPADFEISKSKSMGIKLIHTLTKQLNGTVQVYNKNGAHFQFNFKQNRIAI